MMAYRTKTTTNGFGFHITNSVLSRTREACYYPKQELSLPFTTAVGNSQRALSNWKNLKQQTSDDNDLEKNQYPSSSFAMDPNSDEAHHLMNSLGITDATKQEQLKKLAHSIVEWNERLNLISRKDCTVDVVFGRHVLPSIALSVLPDFLPPLALEEESSSDGAPLYHSRVVDVGTGGGLPGVPLAILYPGAQFLLVDSVGKKLKAVEEMVNDLGLKNVRTHHGRVEEMVNDPVSGSLHKGSYDVCVGRSVTALPRFCFWVQDLLKKGVVDGDINEEGKLVYIIGGEVETMVLSRVKSDTPIDNLIGREGVSDKRILVIGGNDIISIAAESGETKPKIGVKKSKSNPKKSKEKVKGSWIKRDNALKKERGYDDFQRYN